MLLDQYYSNNNNTYPQNNIYLNQKRAYGKKPKFTRHLTVSFKSCLYKKAIIVKNNTFKSLKKTTIKKVNINKTPMITDKFRLRRRYNHYLTNNVIK